MSRRISMIVLLGSLVFAGACTNKKVVNPLADVGSKQPDKVLFDRAMDAMKHNRFDVARLTLQTLINTYPDSEFIARAKLAVADSWYAEGGTTALAQAESEYKDFITFFPNMPEAAEAQLKIGNIHYAEMEKPDRDYTHALRAEDEYRSLIQQFPESKLVPEAKKKLLEVQEVLADREFRIGRFYYYRGSFPASIARLKTLVARYPLYSKADEALYLLGQANESEINLVRTHSPKEMKRVQQEAQERMLKEFAEQAGSAYSQILTRYPMMDRAADAQARLQALNLPVPRPTKAAVAQNKAEEASRREAGTMAKLMRNFQKHPDVSPAAHVGEPTIADAKPISASDVVKQATAAMMGPTNATASAKLGIEVVGTGPSSDGGDAAALGLKPPDPNAPAVAVVPDANELMPNVPADPNELKPGVADAGSVPPAAPTQVNEIQGGAQAADSAQANPPAGTAVAADGSQEIDPNYNVSSSKPKKKKGLGKLNPF